MTRDRYTLISDFSMYDVFARYYDLIHKSLTVDLDLIKMLVASRGGPILELGCGTGRLLLPLARAGYFVTGVDNAPAMLAQARQRLEQESREVQERVALVEADIRHLPSLDEDSRYALVLVSYNTLLHFQAKAIRQVFSGVRRYIRNDGHLYLDINSPYAIEATIYDIEPTLENSFVDPDSGETVRQLSRSWLELSEQRLHTTWTFETVAGSGQSVLRSTADVDYWYQYPHQLELLLQQTGFKLEQMMGDYDGSTFDEESERLLIIARPVAR